MRVVLPKGGEPEPRNVVKVVGGNNVLLITLMTIDLMLGCHFGAILADVTVI